MEQQVREATVVVRGDVPDQLVAYAREKLLAIVADASAPVLGVELRLDHHIDPARERPNHVEVTIDLDGRRVRAHSSAPTMSEAVDHALARLRRRFEVATESPRALRLRHRDTESWHHDDPPAERPHFYPRPAEERRLVRRKTFALHAESIEEALYDLEALDHDFFLFVHDETGGEAVVYRVLAGYGVMQRIPTPEAIDRVEIPLEVGPHPSETTLENALALLEESDAPFVFFVDATSGRGLVTYRRYDGHYGLVLPS